MPPAPETPETDEISSEAAAASAPDVVADSLGEYVKIWWARVRGGESGFLPVLLGLAAIVIYFQVRNSLFLSAGNLVNLMTQAAWIVMLGMAEVFVLLLGEIDLSIGYSSAIGATIIGVAVQGRKRSPVPSGESPSANWKPDLLPTEHS
jgi:D-xylose transport system permease protein